MHWLFILGQLTTYLAAYIVLNHRLKLQEDIEHQRMLITASEEKYRQIVEIAQEGIWIVDLEAKTTFANPAMAAMLGTTEQEMLGCEFFAFCDPESVDDARQKFNQLLAGIKDSYDLLLRNQKDSTVWTKVSASPVFDPDGHLQAAMFMVRDISKEVLSLRELEDQRVKASMSAKLTALGEMAGGVAHEINNPLAVIHGTSHLMLQAINNPNGVDKEKVNHQVTRIQSMVDRIVRIIRGLRAVARDAEHDPFEVVSLEKIFSDTLDLCQQKFSSHAVSIIVEPPAPELACECRPTQITQVLINLLNNAFDAVVKESDRWIRLAALQQGDKIVISCTDSGPGIPQALRERILEPFFSTKPYGQGQGLGLSISRGIIQSHHGQLTLVDGSEHTEFQITLPIKQTKTTDKLQAS